MLHFALLLVLCLMSLMDLTIAHMVWIHERTDLCLNALDTTHVLIKFLLYSCVGFLNTFIRCSVIYAKDVNCSIFYFSSRSLASDFTRID
jgi:hypothetical protein